MRAPGSDRLAGRLARWVAGLVLGLAAAWAWPAAAGGPSAVRFGEHPGFGRIVFDAQNSEAFSIERSGDMLRVLITGGALLPGGNPPRNVRAVANAPGVVTIQLAPGAGTRRLSVGHRLVIDVLDPPAHVVQPAPPARSSDTRRPADSAMAPPAPTVGFLRSHAERRVEPEAVAGEANSAPAPQPPPPAPTPGPALLAATDPVALVADAQTVPNAGPGHMLSVPFAPQVGAAAFRHGAEAIVVFDERKPIDLESLKDDPVFGSAIVQLLPNATVLRLTLASPAELRLERRKGGWIVTAIGGNAIPPALRPIVPDITPALVQLPAAQPGLVVSVPDSITGGILMVGTQREAGQGVAVARRAPDFELLPTWQGVAVEAVSDSVALRAVTSGFALGTEGDGNTMVSSLPDPGSLTAAGASRMSRMFDFPRLRTESLIRRMQGAVLAASAAPAQSKAAARGAVAESMVALGMGAEAQAVLSLASIGDARTEDDPAMQGLGAIAALLAGRTDQTDGLDDPRLGGADEIALWRAVRQAMRIEGSAAAAQIFANTLPLLANYPDELRAKILPLVAETMALGGQESAAQKLLNQNKDDHTLDLARALLAQARGGDPAEVQALYDRLSQSSDRLVRLRAARSGAELRLASGKATPAETAAVLAKLLYAWRGDDREIDLRLRVAQLQADSNQWRPALQLLRETEATWPEQSELIHARLRGIFAQSLMPSAQAGLKPFDLVALAEENADLMPDGEAGQRLAEQVCEQLIALDLPERAIPFLETMVAKAPQGAARSAFGGRLAALLLAKPDPGAAIAVLTATVNDSMPPSLLEGRSLTFAAAVAAQGDFVSAKNALVELDTEAGDRTLADLAEQRKLWPEAVSALQHYAARLVPPTGALDEPQTRLLLRLASAASEAGDEAMLARLRDQAAARLAPGKTADLFNLLTEQKIRGMGDVAHVTRDVALAHAIPGALPPLASR